MKSKFIKTLAMSGICFVFLFSSAAKAQSLKDISGNEYKIAKLGLQEWSASNLNVSKFRNGDAIPEAKTPEEWKNAGLAGKPAWCYFDNNAENGKLYGKLYNWYALNDPRGLAPKGWHIPENNDWRVLIKNLLGIDMAGQRLKSTTGWKSMPGNDYIGFKALPGGYRNSDGKFESLGFKCQFWSNSEPVEVVKSNKIFSTLLNDRTVEISYAPMAKECGLSVRVIKDKE
jgi:uncharacterized protein (TIGR02145 family)